MITLAMVYQDGAVTRGQRFVDYHGITGFDWQQQKTVSISPLFLTVQDTSPEGCMLSFHDISGLPQSLYLQPGEPAYFEEGAYEFFSNSTRVFRMEHLVKVCGAGN